MFRITSNCFIGRLIRIYQVVLDEQEAERQRVREAERQRLLELQRQQQEAIRQQVHSTAQFYAAMLCPRVCTGFFILPILHKFHAIAAPLIDKFKKHKVEPSSIVLRDMPTRWGSCTPKGKIILNPELIKAPKGCIEYVIIHELCHLIHHDHTQKFLDLQTKEMKDWEKWKMKLEKLLA